MISIIVIIIITVTITITFVITVLIQTTFIGRERVTEARGVHELPHAWLHLAAPSKLVGLGFRV